MKKVTIVLTLILACLTSTYAENYKKAMSVEPCTRSFSGNGYTATVTDWGGDCNKAFIAAYYAWKVAQL